MNRRRSARQQSLFIGATKTLMARSGKLKSITGLGKNYAAGAESSHHGLYYGKLALTSGVLDDDGP